MEVTRISLYELLAKGDAESVALGNDRPEKVRLELSRALKESGTISIDLGKIRSLSPSFAYEAFGKLVDEFGHTVLERLKFENDVAGLQSRVSSAIERRRNVVRERAS